MQHHTGHATSPPGADEGRFLATAVSCNALFSSACGLALLVGGVALDRWLAVPAWMLMVVGAGLVVFAGLLVWLLAQPQHLVTGARLVVAADAVWVAGAAALLVWFPSVLSPTGRTALGVASAAVAVLAIAQVVGLHRVGAGPVTGASRIVVQAQRAIAAPAEQVWDAVADAGAYARFAPGIATTVVSGYGQDMVRVCTDARRSRWRERCTLWDEGTRYRMTVDVDSYPVHYRMLLHGLAQTWTVEPAAGGSRVTLTVDGAVKLGVPGRLAARTLGSPRRLEAILDAYEHHLAAQHRLAGR